MRYHWWFGALIALASCGGPGDQSADGNAGAAAPAAAETEGPIKGVDRSHKGAPAPAALFDDPDGGRIALTAFKGVPVLVNLWASWCAPCVKELPTLNALSKKHRVDGTLGVVAVSEDSAPQQSVVAFLKSHKIDDLAPYHDPGMQLSGALNAQILPTSVLYDAQGKEVWRYVGEADWTSAQAASLLAEGGGEAR
ncbi:MAG: TlpA disulfide reductase family protein [Pseudomonadota bacterium]